VLRRIFGPKREEDGSWRKLQNDKFHNLYFSWRRGEMLTVFLLGDPKGRQHWEDLGLRGKVLRWFLGRYGSMMRSEFFWLRIGYGGGLL
jgi:hypothetical protein